MDVKDFALEALVAIVERETIMQRHDLLQYEKLQFDPLTPAYLELCHRFASCGARPIVESPGTSSNRPKVETVTPALCKGMPHGSCKGETMCDPTKVCFKPA